MHRKPHKTNTGRIDLDHTAPGMGVSSDGMEAGIPWKVFSTHGIPTAKIYKYATFWVNHFSRFVYFTLHETKRAEELLKSKQGFEDFTAHYGVSISRIWADNGVYIAKIISDNCLLLCCWRSLAERYCQALHRESGLLHLHHSSSCNDEMATNCYLIYVALCTVSHGKFS
jgi:hypothetical protein